MSDVRTRRVIEVQSDLYQKGGIETLQYNLNNSNKTNDNLNKPIERIKRNNRYLVSGGAVCAIAFIVCLLVK